MKEVRIFRTSFLYEVRGKVDFAKKAGQPCKNNSRFAK